VITLQEEVLDWYERGGASWLSTRGLACIDNEYGSRKPWYSMHLGLVGDPEPTGCLTQPSHVAESGPSEKLVLSDALGL
jgi:hypothetical protein